MLKKLKKYLRKALSLIFPSLKSKPKKAKKKGGEKVRQKATTVAQKAVDLESQNAPRSAAPEQKAEKKVEGRSRSQHVPPSFPFHPTDLPSAWKSVESAEDAIQVLEIRGRSLGRPRGAPAIRERLEGVLKRFDRISWHSSVAPPADSDPVPASSTDMLVFDANTCFDLGDIWFVDRETLRLRMLPKNGGEATFQIVRCYQRDPAHENSVRQLMEQPVASDTTTFVDVKLANPYLPLLMSVCEQGGELVELVILPFPSLCRGGPHYGELLATTGKKPYLGVLCEVGGMLLQSALHRQPSARLTELKIDLRPATGTERIFAPDLLYWLKSVLGLKLVASHLPSAENDTVRNYILASLGVEPGVAAHVLGEGGKALRLSVDAIPTVEALMSNWGFGAAIVESGFVMASIHDNMPKWLFRPPERPCGAVNSMEAGALFPELELLDSSALGTENVQPRTAVSAIRFCRFGPIDEVSLVYPTMSTDAIESAGSTAVEAAAVPTTTALLNASADAIAAIACLEAIALQLGVQGLKVLVAGDLADAPLIENHLQRLFPGAGRFIVAEEGESNNAVLNRLAAMVESELLLIMAAPILLHEPRSIQKLASLMVSADVASASCFLIGERQSNKNLVKLAPVFAGWFGEIGADGQISSIISALEETLPLLPPARWPVASSSGRVLMARTAEWRQFGGFDEAGQNMTTKFWSNMISMGRFHLLTTTFTAGLQSREGEQIDIFSMETDLFPDLRQLETSSVQIRRLVA
ncbi:hypothetical protein KX729_17210 [Rhizobium sp. XQZ8]|uniref:hypothetical protein n=1 Tax=Rhizobium populisoli TaxID=2859785 RepID=UPI001CA4912E|nr:hypothetical protein [Rhizobium populisoli]MBW6423199.1 hypothetical protein [Rhizobium populisoli]